jgi:shikimate kinase
MPDSRTQSRSARFIILMGLRGSGKTTVASMLSPLGVVRDLDTYVASSLGLPSAAAVIERDGLEGFRTAEGRCLRLLLRLPVRPRRPLIIALGGGTPTGTEAGQLLSSPKKRKRMCVIYLHASPACLREHLRSTDLTQRPSLTGKSVLDEIDDLYAVRDPLYRALAHVILDVTNEAPQETAHRVSALLGSR